MNKLEMKLKLIELEEENNKIERLINDENDKMKTQIYLFKIDLLNKFDIVNSGPKISPNFSIKNILAKLIIECNKKSLYDGVAQAVYDTLDVIFDENNYHDDSNIDNLISIINKTIYNFDVKFDNVTNNKFHYIGLDNNNKIEIIDLIDFYKNINYDIKEKIYEYESQIKKNNRKIEVLNEYINDI